MFQKVIVFLFKPKNYRKYRHILQPVVAENTSESGCLLKLIGSENVKEGEAAAFKSGMCVCLYMHLKYCLVMMYSYKYYETISFEATFGLPQIDPFFAFFFSQQLHNGHTMHFQLVIDIQKCSKVILASIRKGFCR